MTGTSIRLGQLMRADTGRGVVVAFDHGCNGVPPGGEDPDRTLSSLMENNPEGILLGTGLAESLASRLGSPGAPRLIVPLDSAVWGTGPGMSGPMTAHRLLTGAERALRLGAVTGKVLLPLGLSEEERYADALRSIAVASEECQQSGLPLMIEPAFWGPQATTPSDDSIAHAARLSVELGAATLKIPATHDPDRLTDIITHSPVPTFVLGGAPTETPAEFAANLISWTKAGVAGVVIGRNVWSKPQPAEAVRGLQEAVHNEDKSACVHHLETANHPAP